MGGVESRGGYRADHVDRLLHCLVRLRLLQASKHRVYGDQPAVVLMEEKVSQSQFLKEFTLPCEGNV